MKLISAFLYTAFTYITLQLAICSNVLAETIENPERWFEIEVILFNQLDNKSLKEKFPEEVTALNLPNYPQSFDLLTHYIQRDLSDIKQLLPVCDDEAVQPHHLKHFPNKSLLFNKEISSLDALTELNHIQIEKDFYNFDFYNQVLAKEVFSTDKLCFIPKKEMAKLFNKQQLENINLNTVEIKFIPSELNALGEHNPHSPYLISDDSLLLKDINKRLSWSQEFKPLLHFGWRQIGITKKDAIPLKLIAGQHMEYEYKKALFNYQTSSINAKTLKTNLTDQANNYDVFFNDATSPDNQEALVLKNNNQQAQVTQQALNTLFLKAEDLNKKTIDEVTINKTINEISVQSIDSTLSKRHKQDSTHAALDIYEETEDFPIKPLQPWFLNGFLKVHLDHYLYITADFNILNQKNNEDSIDQVDKKLINFSQNRRVITGEIHYFDHPHIGMIIQTRRFDPNKPEGEQVSQSIK